jgi:hypothetical protein
MQPGSESRTAISSCEENNVDVVHGVCVMFERMRALAYTRTHTAVEHPSLMRPWYRHLHCARV